MSLLLKAFPHGRPSRHARPDRPGERANRPALATVVISVVAVLAVLLPLAGPAEAKRPKPHKPRPHVVKVVGQPPRSFLVQPTSYFSFPNRSNAERQAIRKRVLLSIQSTWGGRRTRSGLPRIGNGSIRIATWSFDDWNIAKALVAARKRGVSVQIVAAKAANRDHAAWHWLRDRLGQRLFRPGAKTTRDKVSFARVCKGACRGPGGTPHSKYFLFDNVGPRHTRKVTFQTSSNLTSMAYQGQWNQAQVMYSSAVYDDFLHVFRQTRIGKPLANPYYVKSHGGTVVDYFFPRPQAKAAQDPVMQILNGVTCRGAVTANGRTKIRILQYAIYGDRGVWIAKKLRLLWRGGCDIAIIYAVSSRPVLSILRSGAGRGPIPMKQSVVKDAWGNIVKYNHSKWMTIRGHWFRSTEAYETFSGSANWANLAFGDDEQMQRISDRHEALRHNVNFAKTWRQGSSTKPTAARVMTFGRALGPATYTYGRDVPAEEPAFGQGVFRYMTSD
jgi:hypothetical protein